MSKMDESSESSIPNLEISDELILIDKNNISTGELSKDQINRLLRLMTSWIDVMQKEIDLVEDIKSGRIQDGAISEYKFWNKRYVNFKTILKQLSTSKAVKKNITIMEIITDNKNVLYTLKNFKDLEFDFKIIFDTTVMNTKYFIDSIYEELDAIVNAPFSVIIDNIATLYNNLTLMWLTSSFYGRKEHMGRLIESISNLIADRISTTLAVPSIFRYKPEDAILLIKNTLILLDQWKSKYIKCKQGIEILSVSYFSRWAWEFDESIIFHRLDYVYIVVKDLLDIMKITEQLKNINTEVGFVFKNINQAHLFLRDCISFAFFDLKTNVYEINNKENNIWKKAMTTFITKLQSNLISSFIMSLNVSKSAFHSLKALKKFGNPNGTHYSKLLDVQNTNMILLYLIPLNKFEREIDNFELQFNSLKSSSKLYMINVPPVTAKIIFVHDLFLRAKSTARALESASSEIPDVLKFRLSLILSKYGYFCKEVFTYENDIFEQWLKDAIKIEGYHVQTPLLIYRDKNIVSTFDKSLFDVMETALQLHHLDYDLPEIIMNIIERREQILSNVKQIDKLVNMYNEIVNKMDAPITLAMDHHFAKIKDSLHPGLEKRYTYLSIQLPKFLKKTMRVFKVFNVIYNEIKSYELVISEKLNLIENLVFIPADINEGVQGILKMFDKYQIEADKNVSVITHAMNYIAEALNLIERKCYDVKTGYHEQMSLFYKKYENALFETFVKMVVKNFKKLNNILKSENAFFFIHGRLIENKITIASEIKNVTIVFTRSMNYLLDELKSIPRWLKNTNIRCPLVQNVVTFDTYLSSSFYYYVVNCQEVSDIIKECYVSTRNLNNRLEKTAQKLSKFEFLFETQDKLIINQFSATKPTLSDYKEKLESLNKLSESLKTQSYLDVGCIRLDYSEYNVKLLERCKFWHVAYEKQLIIQCEKIMTKFSKRIMTLKKQLNIHFRDIQGLVTVEKSIKEIKETVFYADSLIHDIHTQFHFMKKYKILIPKDLLKQFNNLKTNWQKLYEEALSKSFCFEDAKKGLIGVSS